MKKAQVKKLMKTSLLGLTAATLSVHAEPRIEVPQEKQTFNETSTDFSYAFCEGVGAFASGRVNLRAEYTKTSSNVYNVGELRVVGTYTKPYQMAGKITFVNSDGKTQSITLVTPWYAGFQGEGSSVLTIPKATDGSGVGLFNKKPFTINTTGQVKLDLSVLFTSGNGNCPTSYSETFNL